MDLDVEISTVSTVSDDDNLYGNGALGIHESVEMNVKSDKEPGEGQSLGQEGFDTSKYFIGEMGQICESQVILDFISSDYEHIDANVFRRGTNGRIPSECQICMCTVDPKRPLDSCGPDSGCFNRELCIECTDSCPTGLHCQNQRFQKRLNVPIEVFKTAKKGLGLRTVIPIKSGDFLFEYCGEVLTESMFKNRIQERQEKNKRHFYYMTLKKNEIIDASEKGNFSRFINHSCNPNCSLEKWVVGDQLRLGLFATREILPGEECTFNYQYEVHGEKAQTCHCGEPGCTGFIGRVRSDSGVLVGCSDSEDSYDDDVLESSSTKRIKKKAINRPLMTREEVVTLLKNIYQNTDKKARVRHCLARLEKTDEGQLLRKVVYTGLIVLKVCLKYYLEDKSTHPLAKQILIILQKLPIRKRVSLKKIALDDLVESILTKSDVDPDILEIAKALFESWTQLEEGYIIPKRSRYDAPSLTVNISAAAVDDWVNNSGETPTISSASLIDEDEITHISGKYAKVRPPLANTNQQSHTPRGRSTSKSPRRHRSPSRDRKGEKSVSPPRRVRSSSRSPYRPMGPGRRASFVERPTYHSPQKYDLGRKRCSSRSRSREDPSRTRYSDSPQKTRSPLPLYVPEPPVIVQETSSDPVASLPTDEMEDSESITMEDTEGTEEKDKALAKLEKSLKNSLTNALLDKQLKSGKEHGGKLSSKGSLKAKEYVKAYLERKNYNLDKNSESKPEKPKEKSKSKH